MATTEDLTTEAGPQFSAPEPGVAYRDRPAAFAVVERDGLIACVLITRPEQSYYDLPGGAVEAGETDEEALVRLGEEMMAELGYEPVGFASSAAALETFRAMPQRFDAVLSDEAMPELTGSELAREIRRIRPDIPIVLMTGYVTPALSARAREVGVVEVLSKPLVASDIARSLAGALRRESTDEVEPMPG